MRTGQQPPRLRILGRSALVVTGVAALFLTIGVVVAAVDSAPQQATADVSIDQVAPMAVDPGGLLTYTITYRNQGPEPASDVVITDTLPPNVTYVETRDSNLDPPQVNGREVVWQVGSLAAEATGSLVLVARVGADQPSYTVLTNTLRISTSTSESDTTNNISQATTTVRPGPPATIQLTVPATATVGTSLPLRAEVLDAWDNPVADGTEVRFQTNERATVQPSALTLAGVATATLTLDTQPGTVVITATAGTVTATGTLDVLPGPPGSVILSATPTMLQAGQVAQLYAQVLDDYGNPVGAGTRVTFATTLGSVQPPTATTAADSIATATLTSTLSGTAIVTATASAVQDRALVTFLPGPPSGVSLSADPPAIPVDGATSQILATVTDRFGNRTTEEVTVTFATSLGTLAPVTTTAVAGQASTVLTSGPLHGTAEVTATVASHIGTTTVQIQPADLVIACQNTPSGDILPGTTVTYTIEYSNQGAAVARGVRITNTLPVGFVDPVVSWSGATITLTQGTTYVWEVEDLSPGEGGTIVIQGRFDRQRAWPASQFVTNEVLIRSETAEGNPADNLAAAGNLVVTADLYIQKASSPFNDFSPGSRIRYEIAFGNYQRVPAENVIITDTLPAYTRFSSDTAAQAGLTRLSDPEAPVQVWRRNTPVEGPNAGRFVVWLDIDSNAPGGAMLTNQVEIGSTTPESRYTNNRITVTAVLSGVNLVATLRGPERIIPGQAITYTLRYTNTGRDPAPGAVLTHTLPAGVSFQSATRPPDDLASDRAVWQLGELPAGQSGFIALFGQVATTVRAPQLITSVLTITSAAMESYAADNVAQWGTQVMPDVPFTLTVESPFTAIPVGGTPAPIRVRVTDRFGNPVDGVTVTLSTTAGVITPTVASTVDGEVTAILTSPTQVGSATVFAQAGKLKDSIVIGFLPGPPAVLLLEATPTELPADGASRATIQATVQDAYGNPVADNTPVVFSTTLGRLYNGFNRHVVGTFDGLAATTLQAGHTPGIARVRAEVEGLVREVEVVFLEVPTWWVYMPLVTVNSDQ